MASSATSSGWNVVADPRQRGRPIYHNMVSGQSTYEKPLSLKVRSMS